MRARVLLMLLLVAPALAGCAGEAGSFTTHPVEEWKPLYEATEGAFLLDVRTNEEFDAGHIAGAALIPHTDLLARRDELPEDKATPIFVYCRSGHRSEIASRVLAEMGYSDVHDLGGGIIAWAQAGHALVQ